MSLALIVGLCAVAGGAAAMQSVSGFGFALISVPLFAIVIDAKDAVALASLLGLASSVVLFARAHRDVCWPVAGRMLGAACAGMPLGLYVLVVVDERVLRGVIAVVVGLLTVSLATGVTVRGRGRAVDVSAGFVSGVLNTSVSTNGPPLVLALQAQGLAPNVFRATISAVFVVSSIVGDVLFLAAGRYTAEVWRAAAVAAPAMVAGWLVGAVIAPRVPPERFRTLVLVLLGLTSLSALVSVAWG